VPLNPRRVTLDNGVTVIAKSNHTTPAVSLLVGVRNGAYSDPPDRDGTAALCARVLDRGTVTRSADAIADDLDGRGASLSVAAGRHQMAIAATCLSDDFPAVLALAADVARHPRFADAEIETRRDNLITSIRQEEDNPASMAADAFAKALYGTHPYARKVRGSVASIESIRRQDLVRFHQKGFDPPAITVVVVGDVEEDAAIKAISKLFGDWNPITKPGAEKTVVKVADVAVPAERKLVSVPMMNKAQADVVYGFVGIRRSDPDYTAYSVMNNALGQYAIGGRLGDSIRERQGMAYYVYSSLDATFGHGPFSIKAGVAAENVEKTIASIDEELKAIMSAGFTAKEIDESKSYMIGAIPRQLETNAAIAAFLLTCDTFNLGLDYDERLPGLIGAITKEAADAAARKLLDPARATIAVAGPWTPAVASPSVTAQAATPPAVTAPALAAPVAIPAVAATPAPPVEAPPVAVSPAADLLAAAPPVVEPPAEGPTAADLLAAAPPAPTPPHPTPPAEPIDSLLEDLAAFDGTGSSDADPGKAGPSGS
jgi:zinc protease